MCSKMQGVYKTFMIIGAALALLLVQAIFAADVTIHETIEASKDVQDYMNQYVATPALVEIALASAIPPRTKFVYMCWGVEAIRKIYKQECDRLRNIEESCPKSFVRKTVLSSSLEQIVSFDITEYNSSRSERLADKTKSGNYTHLARLTSNFGRCIEACRDSNFFAIKNFLNIKGISITADDGFDPIALWEENRVILDFLESIVNKWRHAVTHLFLLASMPPQHESSLFWTSLKKISRNSITQIILPSILESSIATTACLLSQMLQSVVSIELLFSIEPISTTSPSVFHEVATRVWDDHNGANDFLLAKNDNGKLINVHYDHKQYYYVPTPKEIRSEPARIKFGKAIYEQMDLAKGSWQQLSESDEDRKRKICLYIHTTAWSATISFESVHYFFRFSENNLAETPLNFFRSCVKECLKLEVEANTKHQIAVNKLCINMKGLTESQRATAVEDAPQAKLYEQALEAEIKLEVPELEERVNGKEAELLLEICVNTTRAFLHTKEHVSWKAYPLESDPLLRRGSSYK